MGEGDGIRCAVFQSFLFSLFFSYWYIFSIVNTLMWFEKIMHILIPIPFCKHGEYHMNLSVSCFFSLKNTPWKYFHTQIYPICFTAKQRSCEWAPGYLLTFAVKSNPAVRGYLSHLQGCLQEELPKGSVLLRLLGNSQVPA